MTITIIIFLIAIIGAFGMLTFRAWEIRTSKIIIEGEPKKHIPELSLRQIEIIALHLLKHIVQWIVLSCVKLWLIIISKGKILIKNKLPKINNLFKKKVKSTDPRKISFVQRAVLESKIKIKKVKEKIKEEQEEEIQNIERDEVEVEKNL